MSKSKRGESETSTNPGQDASENTDALTPEVVPNKANATSKRGRGRPAIHTDLDKPVVRNFIVHLIRRKESDREIARQVNVPKATFDRWKKKNIELWAIDAQDDQTDLAKVKRSLVERATGHWVERVIYNKDGTVKGTKYQYYPPSDAAIQYYLNNRDPANWKSKVEHNHAVEELPIAVNFINGPAPQAVEASPSTPALPDKIDGNENQGNS